MGKRDKAILKKHAKMLLHLPREVNRSTYEMVLDTIASKNEEQWHLGKSQSNWSYRTSLMLRAMRRDLACMESRCKYNGKDLPDWFIRARDTSAALAPYESPEDSDGVESGVTLTPEVSCDTTDSDTGNGSGTSMEDDSAVTLCLEQRVASDEKTIDNVEDNEPEKKSGLGYRRMRSKMCLANDVEENISAGKSRQDYTYAWDSKLQASFRCRAHTGTTAPDWCTEEPEYALDQLLPPADGRA